MDVKTDGRSIELDMDNRIMKSCEDDISTTYHIAKTNAPEILEYLKGKYTCSTQEFEDDVLFLYVNWHRHSKDQQKQSKGEFLKKIFGL